MVRFFTPEQETRIIEAIRQAERQTSGEIRVHLEDNGKRPALEDAKRVFHKLGMDRTADRNGVLILLSVDRHEFAIVGDKGINEKVPAGFWEDERNLMQDHFRRGEFCEGLVAAIDQVGEKLKTFFPYQTDDENELPDDISYGSS